MFFYIIQLEVKYTVTFSIYSNQEFKHLLTIVAPPAF
jgi:hypothetical protein